MADLFSNISEIQEYIPTVNNSVELSDLSKPVKRACDNHILVIVGKEMFEEIVSNPADFPELIELIKTSAVAFACGSSTSLVGIQISDSGILQTKNEGQQIARLQDIESFKIEVFDIAYKALDDIAIFLEEHQNEKLDEESLKYQKWIDSPQYTLAKGSFIRSASQFQNFVNIRLSRRVFQHLRPAIKRIESLKIKPLLGDALFKALKDSQTDDVRKELVEEIICPAIANLAFANGIDELSVIVDKYDTTTQFDNTNLANSKSYKASSDNRINSLAAKRDNDGLAFLAQIIPFLFANQSKFTEYNFPPEAVAPAEYTPDADWRFYAPL